LHLTGVRCFADPPRKEEGEESKTPGESRALDYAVSGCYSAGVAIGCRCDWFGPVRACSSCSHKL
jgi:hypothetical protein